MTPRERWIRFATVGTLGMAVQLAVVGLIANRWHAHYLWATGLGVLAAVAHNFAWHRRWTWRDRPDSRGLVATFLAFSAANGLVSLAGNLLVMRVLVGTLHTPAIAASLVAITTCAVINYVVADRVVFATGTTGTTGTRGTTGTSGMGYVRYDGAIVTTDVSYPTYPSIYDRRHRPHDIARPIGRSRSLRRVPAS